MDVGGMTYSEVAGASARALMDYIERPPGWNPRPHQIPPPGNWYGWLLNAGRGAGKTRTCSQYVIDHVKGPPCLPGSTPHWIGIIGPTLGDAVTACFSGPSGIGPNDPTAKLAGGLGGTVIKWSNGSQAKLFGASTPDDIERLRAGGNTCLVWAEELAAWRHLEACYQQMRFGLRTGKTPRWVASTTPKPKLLIKKLVKQTPHNVVVTHATTHDNPHLEQHVRDELFAEYEDTQIGRQELYAEVMDQDENALWRRDDIDEHRVKPGEVPNLIRVTVGVDPSGGAGEQGIVVAGKYALDEIVKGRKQKRFEGFVLGDRTCRLGPAGWGSRAVQAAIDWEADDIVVETNYGGEMAVVTIRDAALAMGITIPVKMVVATRGKRVRAEPVAALSTRGQWHHVGTFAELEDQLCVTADTRVLTQRGYVQITDIVPGDFVMTRAGLAPIAWCGITGTTQKLMNVGVQGSLLSCTLKHPVFIPRQDEFVDAKNVKVGDRLLVDPNWEKMACQSLGVGAGGVVPWVDTSDTVEASSCTELSGKLIEVPSLMDISFITSIMTKAMAGLKTSNLSLQKNILKNTAAKPRFIDEHLSKVLKTVGRNDEMSGLVVNHATSSVQTVAKSFNPQAQQLRTVQSTVTEKLDDSVFVYNLTVAPGYLHEYYANGILVHNCTWTPELDYSPDRLDAMVWTAWHNKIVATRPRGMGSFAGGGSMSRSIG